MAVETVFESMKRALVRANVSSSVGSGFLMSVHVRLALGVIRELEPKWRFRRAKAVRFKPGKELQTLQ